MSLLFWAFLWLLPVCPSLVQAAPLVLSAILEADRTEIFQYETFSITLSIRSTGVRLGKKIDLLGLPHESRLQFIGNFANLPLQRTQSGETRRFRVKARAGMVGTLKMAPVLRVGILSRQRAFIGWRWMEQPRDVRVRPLTLSIKPLPATGRPEDFSGAVGQFSFDVDIVPRDVAVGDLITAVMRIHGNGYLEGILPPRASPGKNFKVYDPEAVAGKDAGEKVIEQILIPQSTNAIEIPALTFSYFDPQAAAYRILTRGPFPLTFHGPQTVSFESYEPVASFPATNGDVRVAPSSPLTLLQRLSLSLRNGLRKGKTRTVQRREAARIAPALSAVRSFELTDGSVVRVLAIYGRWVKISFGNRRGWIRVEALAPIGRSEKK